MDAEQLVERLPRVEGRLARFTRFIALVPLAVFLTSCGGGGSGGTTPPPATYTLSGRVQKGPFAVGSAVSVNEQNASLAPTGKVYNVQTSDALGDFAVPSSIGTPQVEIIAQGFYVDELTGQLSASQITLRAIADLSVNSSPTVNVLTTLQEQRLKTLVSQGSTFTAAATQSEKEVLALFGIDATKVNSLSPLASMRIDGGMDADSALLAASVVLSQVATDTAKANGTTQAAELSNLVNALAEQLSTSGTVTNPSFTAARNLAESEINVAAVTSNLQTYYANNGANVVAPMFQEWLDPSNSGVLPQRLVSVSGLAFNDVTTAGPGQSVTSNSVTVAGAGAGVVVPVAVSVGTTLLKNNSVVAGTNSIAQDGDVIALRVTAPGYLIASKSMISLGASSAAWNVTSQPLGGTVSGLTGTGLVLQNNGANNVTVPPNSTSFSFPRSMAIGSTYSVSVLTQPTSPLQSCAVSNGSGTVGTAPSNIAVVCAASYGLAFVANQNSNNISVYAIDSSSGGLMPVAGSPVATGTWPVSITVDTISKFVYAANYTSNTVSGYSYTSAGTLTPIPGSPFAAGTNPYSVTIDPAGNFAYVTNFGDDTITVYAIDASTGALTAIPGSPFGAAGSSPISVKIDPTGNFAYVANEHSNNVYAFSVNATTGVLTPIAGSPYAAAPTPFSIAVNPPGSFAYVADWTFPGQVSGYAIDAATGALTPVPGSPFASGADESTAVAVDPTGKYLFVSNSSFGGGANGAVSAFTIDSTTGALASVPGSPFAAGSDPQSIVVAPNGAFVYVANFNSNNVSAYAVNASSGALTAVAGSPFAAGTNPSAVAIATIP